MPGADEGLEDPMPGGGPWSKPFTVLKKKKTREAGERGAAADVPHRAQRLKGGIPAPSSCHARRAKGHRDHKSYRWQACLLLAKAGGQSQVPAHAHQLQA